MLLSLVDRLGGLLSHEGQLKNDHQYLIQAMVKSGLCLISLSESLPSLLLDIDDDYTSIIQMIKYLAEKSIQLSQYHDNDDITHNHHYHHHHQLYPSALLLKQKYEKLSSNYDISNQDFPSLHDAFSTIITKKKLKSKKIKYLKKKVVITLLFD